MQNTTYIDLKTREQETIFFFMLNAFLCSRLETDNESDDDEEVNIYMAQLLLSLVDGSFYSEHAEVLASTPTDVYFKVEEGHTPRHKLQVYRANADHRLVSFGVFGGFGEYQSRHRKAFAAPDAYLEEAQQYYGWAALFCTRLSARYRGLALALEKIAARFGTYCDILGHLSAHHLNLMRQLTPGELFHLEREVNQAALPHIQEEALNHLLDAYNQWQALGTPDSRRHFQEECARYQQVNPAFDPSYFKKGIAEDSQGHIVDRSLQP